jgi:hypothetical protein
VERITELPRELPGGALTDRWRVQRVAVVAGDSGHDPFVRLVERHEVALELDVERAVGAGRCRAMRLVGDDVVLEQSALDRMRAL